MDPYLSLSEFKFKLPALNLSTAIFCCDATSDRLSWNYEAQIW